MSRVYFHTPERTEEVLGAERAYMASLASDITLGILDPDGFDRPQMIRAVARGLPDYLAITTARGWGQAFSTWFRVGDRGCFVLGGHELSAMDLACNTLIKTGSPVLALAAKIHGMCEDHAFVEAQDADWFADIIEQGRALNVLRAGVGWEGIVSLARSVAAGTVDGPIVLSYSVCEGFPNRYVTPMFRPWVDVGVRMEENPEDEAFEEAWEALTQDEQWALAVAGIRTREHNRVISPETFGIGFRNGASAFDIVNKDWDRSAR